MSAPGQHQAYTSGAFSLVEKVEKTLKLIDQQSGLNAYVKVFQPESLKQAAELDARRDRGDKLGALAGLTIAVKDNICLRNQPVTCASEMLRNFVSPYDAAVIERIQAADGIVIGKTNLDEFAMGSSSENSIFGAVKHPLDPGRVAGGSSGGSAVAVAANLCDLALGSDTGGSVRQPAAFCGVVGLKPTYGMVSRYGLVAYASSLDQIGCFGKTAACTAYLLKIIAGHDARDATSSEKPYLTDQQNPQMLSKLRVGIPTQFFPEALDPDIRRLIEAKIDALKEAGAQIVSVDLPMTEYAVAAYYIIATAEASSNLSRYDGVRYGHRATATDLDQMYENTRNYGFGQEVKRRIMLGTYVLSSGYYDAYYRKAQQVRRLIRDEYTKAFSEVDVLLTPTTPGGAFCIGEKLQDPLEMYLSDIFTVTANLAGICAISLPAGALPNGLPVGLQLIGDAFADHQLLQIAGQLEKLSQ